MEGAQQWDDVGDSGSVVGIGWLAGEELPRVGCSSPISRRQGTEQTEWPPRRQTSRSS